VCPFSRDIDVQLSRQSFGGRSDYPKAFDFPLFAIFASRLSSNPLTRSPHARFLILAHLVTFRIPQMPRTSSLRILSRRVLRLKVLSLYEALLLLPSPPHLLIGPRLVFYTCSPVMSTFNFRANALEAAQAIRRHSVFHFLRFLQAGYHPSRLRGPSVLVVLILAHLMTF